MPLDYTDIIIDETGENSYGQILKKRMIWKTPSGLYFQQTIDDNGVITTTEIQP